MSQNVLATDLGGTNLRMGVVTSDGKIIHRERRATPRTNDPHEIVSAISELAERCGSCASSGGSVVAVAAPVIMDITADRVDRSPNLPALNGFSLRTELEKAIGLPTVLENDATAAAIGESWLGASKDVQNSICVTLGTGVGGGLIINGEPLRGPDGTAGEVGHICVEPEGRPCGCGSRGCLEQYSSATALTRWAKELSGTKRSVLSRSTEFSSEDVFNAAMTGDSVAIECFRRLGYYLGIALAGLVNVLDPEMIVFAGGLSSGLEAFLPETRLQIDKRAFRVPARRVKLVPAELGDDAGTLGVARVAFTTF